MFKIGDEVICIDVENEYSDLILYKTYIITDIYSISSGVFILFAPNSSIRYNVKRFILFDEYRRNKILKIQQRCLTKVTP